VGLVNAFVAAFGALTRVPLRTDEDTRLAHVLVCFPIVGALLGLALWLGALLLVSVADKGRGALLAGSLLPVFYWWFTGGENLRGLMWVVDKVPGPRGLLPQHEMYFRVSAFQATVLIKLVCTGALVYTEHAAWLIIAPLVSSAALAELCRNALPGGDAIDGRYTHWIIAGPLVLAIAGWMGAFVAGAIAVVLGWLIVPTVERMLQGARGAPLDTARRAAAEFIDQIILLLGVLYLLGR